MNRRVFSKLLALGAGAFGISASDSCAAGDEGQSGSNARQASDSTAATSATPHREPVNVADFQALAKAALPPATYEYITTGTTDEVTLRDNVAAFQRIRLLPPLLTG